MTIRIRIFESFYDSNAREPKGFLIWRVFQLLRILIWAACSAGILEQPIGAIGTE
jgi:hypothetical protein